MTCFGIICIESRKHKKHHNILNICVCHTNHNLKVRQLHSLYDDINSQAIENGNENKFSSALASMSAALLSDDCPETSRGLSSRYLDICIRQVVVSKHKRVRCYYYMSLLAYAAIHNQTAIVDILIKKNACK